VKQAQWTICEQSGRWAAAVRLAIQRANWPTTAMPRLFEVRRLIELEARLDTQSNEFVMVEIRRANFADMIPWLATASRLYPRARCVVLLDADVAQHADRQQLADALREAGASDVVDSPRKLQSLLALGRRHAETQPLLPNSLPADMSIVAWALASLPWQDE
jgi:hypothetical protein